MLTLAKVSKLRANVLNRTVYRKKGRHIRVVKHALLCVTRTCVRVGLSTPSSATRAFSLESFACERGHTLVSPRVDTATSRRLKRL